MHTKCVPFLCSLICLNRAAYTGYSCVTLRGVVFGGVEISLARLGLCLESMLWFDVGGRWHVAGLTREVREG